MKVNNVLKNAWFFVCGLMYFLAALAIIASMLWLILIFGTWAQG